MTDKQFLLMTRERGGLTFTAHEMHFTRDELRDLVSAIQDQTDGKFVFESAQVERRELAVGDDYKGRMVQAIDRARGVVQYDDGSEESMPPPMALWRLWVEGTAA